MKRMQQSASDNGPLQIVLLLIPLYSRSKKQEKECSNPLRMMVRCKLFAFDSLTLSEQ